MTSGLAWDWGPAEAYPVIFTLATGVVSYRFPDLPEITGAVEAGLFTVEYLEEILEAALHARRQHRQLYPFASRVTSLTGEVMLVPVIGDHNEEPTTPVVEDDQEYE